MVEPRTNGSMWLLATVMSGTKTATVTLSGPPPGYVDDAVPVVVMRVGLR